MNLPKKSSLIKKKFDAYYKNITAKKPVLSKLKLKFVQNIKPHENSSIEKSSNMLKYSKWYINCASMV